MELKDLFSSIEHLEADAEDAHEQKEDLSKKADLLEQAVSKLNEDIKVSEYLQSNRAEVQAEQSQVEEKINLYRQELQNLTEQIEEASDSVSVNEQTLLELQEIGVDVQEGLGFLEARKELIETCNQKLAEIAELLEEAIAARNEKQQTFTSLYGERSFIPLMETHQKTEPWSIVNGVPTTIFDHPFHPDQPRICNQGSAFPQGPRGTCGCCACGTVINKSGGNASEFSTVTYAREHGLCSENGGTSPNSWVRILQGAGIRSNVSTGASLPELAKEVENGRGVIIGVSAATYCPEWYGHYIPGKADGHALVLESVVRNQTTGEILEYIVSDSNGNSPVHACRRVPAATLERAFQRKQKMSVVTDDIIW